MKNKFSLALVALIITALFVPAFVLAQKREQPNTSAGTTTGKNAPAGASRRPRVQTPGNTPAAIVQDFNEALTVIQDHYVDGNKLDFNDVYKSSMTGMLRSLDPHSNYFDREEFEDMLADQHSEYTGIGASILNYVNGNSVDTYITATFAESPAWRAGLRFGDRIDAVDGVAMHGRSSSEVRDKIRGPRGTHVTLSLTRASTGKTEAVEIVRNIVPQPSVPDAYFLRPGVGYIDMTRGFNIDTSDRLESALDYLHERGMTSLVLDLRSNPGGLLDQAILVANRFLPAGQLILTQKGRGMIDKPWWSTNRDPDRTPMVILVNDYTASASEIVAGAMQDHDRAMIVGQTSFGKGLVQSIIRLPEGSGLTLTSAYYYTPSGRLIQRDYSDGSFYNYISRGGTLRDNNTPAPKPNGPASRTDTGRTVYGGGGITPDEFVGPDTISAGQARLRHPIFFFARDLANGHAGNFEDYKVERAIEFNHVISPNDFPITNEVFQAFRDYVAKDSNWKGLLPQVDKNRAFIETQLRFNLAMAAYGIVTSAQVIIHQDTQVAKAVEAMPRARELAMTAMRARMSQP